MTKVTSELRGSYAFGQFRLSVDGTLLLRDSARVALGPKVLQTLLVLVERALDDEHQALIVTAARIGYRFSAPVRLIDSPSDPNRTADEPPPSPTCGKRAA